MGNCFCNLHDMTARLATIQARGPSRAVVALFVCGGGDPSRDAGLELPFCRTQLLDDTGWTTKL